MSCEIIVMFIFFVYDFFCSNFNWNRQNLSRYYCSVDNIGERRENKTEWNGEILFQIKCISTTWYCISQYWISFISTTMSNSLWVLNFICYKGFYSIHRWWAAEKNIYISIKFYKCMLMLIEYKWITEWMNETSPNVNSCLQKLDMNKQLNRYFVIFALNKQNLHPNQLLLPPMTMNSMRVANVGPIDEMWHQSNKFVQKYHIRWDSIFSLIQNHSNFDVIMFAIRSKHWKNSKFSRIF